MTRYLEEFTWSTYADFDDFDEDFIDEEWEFVGDSDKDDDEDSDDDREEPFKPTQWFDDEDGEEDEDASPLFDDNEDDDEWDDDEDYCFWVWPKEIDAAPAQLELDLGEFHRHEWRDTGDGLLCITCGETSEVDFSPRKKKTNQEEFDYWTEILHLT